MTTGPNSVHNSRSGRECHASSAPARLLLVCLIAASVCPLSRAQEPTFKTETKLINLTIIAVDKQGRPFADLSPGDVEVREDGKVQKLISFERADVPRGRPQGGVAAGIAARGAQPATLSTNAAPRYIVLAIDNSTTAFADRQRAIDAAAQWLKTSRSANDRVAVVSLGSVIRVWRFFTTETVPLIAALDEMKQAGVPASEDTMISMLASQMSACRRKQDMKCAMTAAISFDEEERAMLNRRKSILMGLIKLLEPFDSEKRVLYFGDGFLVNPGRLALAAYTSYFGDEPAGVSTDGMRPESNPDFRSSGGMLEGMMKGRTSSELHMRLDHADDMREVTSAALRANVTFYAIDAHGMRAAMAAGDASEDGRAASTMAGLQMLDERVHGTEDALRMMAGETGGRAYFNNNDLVQAANDAVGELAGTYYASYAPSDTRSDGRFRKISLKVRRHDVAARTRAGYLARPIREIRPENAVVQARIVDGAYQSRIRFTFKADDLAWEGQRDKSDSLAIGLMILNEKGELISGEVRAVRLEKPASGDPDFAADWALPLGQTTSVVTVTEMSTSNFATTKFKLNLPPLPASH